MLLFYGSLKECHQAIHVRLGGGGIAFVVVLRFSQRMSSHSCEAIRELLPEFKFKFIYSHLFSYNTTTIKN